MPYRSKPLLVLLVTLLLLAARSSAQNPSNGSPYTAYGFGDLLHANQVPSALMGGAGIAVTEPYSIFSANPASYVGSAQWDQGGLQRPTFEGSVRGLFLDTRTATSSVQRRDGQFMGFSVGVPFGKGRWGLGLGIAPFSDVGYTLVDRQTFVDGTVDYEYAGSGGLNRVFAGVGRVLWQGRPDTLGNAGGRLVLGANFEYYFGGVEQSRKAVYPTGQAYTNTSAYSSLVLSAPTGSFGLHYSTQVIPKAVVKARLQRRELQRRDRMEAWRLAHPGETPANVDRSTRDATPWRLTIGATASPAIALNATNTVLNTTFIRGSSGTESVLDTLPSSGDTKGSLTIPLAYGLGVSIGDQRFLITAEARSRDWTRLRTDIEGFTLPAPLRASMVYTLGARYTPSLEGSLSARMTYRMGLRYSEDYLQVRGTQLRTASISGGISIPLNAAQTNSHLHIGGEFGQRGTSDTELLKERVVSLWVGVSITPWRGERWFRPYQIQ
ncbi:MAG: hypothetical protein JNM91_11000 [Flavobacteriales bacterium]|nr:hypothetical protein [Flavobacteriales bacterium]